MSKLLILVSVTLLMAVTNVLLADVISLTNGTILEGELIGRDNGIVMFRVNGEVKAFQESEIAAVVTEEQTSISNVQDVTPLVISVRAGTRLVLSMLDDVDSRKNGVGSRFRAQLEGALVVNGITVAPRGTIVYGTITDSKQARQTIGSSELAMEFRDILIGDQLLPIATGELSVQGKPEGRRTLRRIARSAALGGLIDGSDGAKTGAAVGAGVSVLTKGQSISVTRGTILETTLRVPLVLNP